MIAEATNIFPIYKVERDCILSKQGDITVAYELVLPEIFTLSDRDYTAYHQTFVKAVRVLQNHTVLHKQDWFLQDSYKADYEGKEGFLARSSEHFFNERPFMSHSCYLFLTKKPDGRRPATSAYTNLLRSTIVPIQTINETIFKNFMDSAGQFERILQDSGFISIKRLGTEELAGTATKAGIIERYCFLLSGNEAPLIRDINLENGLEIGGKYASLYTLSDTENLPALCGSRINYDKYSTDRTKFSIGFASPLGQLLDCDHIYNQYILIGDAQQTIKELEAKKLRLQSLSNYSRENAVAMGAVNDFLNEAVSEQRLPLKAHFNVLAWSDRKEDRELKNKVISSFAQMDCTAKQETDGMAQIWYAGMPGAGADFPVNDTFDTFCEQAVCFFNLETNYRDSISPFGIRLGDRLTGRPVFSDISDEPQRRGWIANRSKFICGPSGSGKSFFTNHLVRSYYEQGAHIMIVDIGHSYKGLCDLVGGYYFTYKEEDPIRFNPFYLPEGGRPDTEKKESIKTLLLTLWKKESEPYRRSEYVAISNALTLYYDYLANNTDIFPCFDSFYEFLLSEYTEVLKQTQVKEKDFDLGSFLYVLNPYYKGGEFDYLLNAHENLDILNQRFIVLELDNLKEHPVLFGVVTLTIMEMIVSKMRKIPHIRKVVLVEEAWKAIAKENMAEHIRYLWKTMRKFYGEPIVVTQEVEDVISSPIVKNAIINNSDTKILLDQSKYQNRFDDIQDLLGLNDKEKALVLSLNRANDPKRKYKEVFISLGGHSKVYRTEVSLREYLTYTTEASEKAKVQEYAMRYGSMQKGIDMLAKEMEGTG
ncbi:TraG family conjugative transposon ATPase [Olivibacter jilunii]|uniref:TraG family conjugative transposon ATPase n=1 Tax=Olivibacter jilunii TaxID=985016 RepID=UPI00102F6FDD|nr:TraG family conjugative transposon ATPase [Olivibacter jilunii]